VIIVRYAQKEEEVYDDLEVVLYDLKASDWLVGVFDCCDWTWDHWTNRTASDHYVCDPVAGVQTFYLLMK